MCRLAAAICLTLSIGGLSSAADLDNLYLTSQWFRLRDAVADPKTPDFYRGAVAAAFNDPATAERYLNAVMKSDPDPVRRVEAGALLVEMYARADHRKAARAQLETLDNLLRDLADAQAVDRSVQRALKRIRAEMAALNAAPDQTVVSRGLSRIPYFLIDNMILLPLIVNGTPANYYLDTGSEESFLGESEAKRLGLTVVPTSIPIPLETYGGHDDAVATGVAVAHDLVIGNVHLRDVAFLVSKDDGPDGILGMPLILALETLRWNSDGTVDIGFPPQPRDPSAANLCLERGRLVTEAAFGSEKLSLFVDTGTPETLLFPTFTHQFAKTIAGFATPEPLTIGNTNFDPGARTLPTLTLHVGGAEVTAGRIHALSRNFTQDGDWAYGNMGNDFAGNARSVTLDFSSMRLTIEGSAASTGSASACTLPPDLACLSGFNCTVSYDPVVRCHVDRIPAQAPAGNPPTNPDTPDPASSCVLPANFICPSGETCTAVFDGHGACHIDHAPSTPAPQPTSETTAAAVPSKPPARPDARQLMEHNLKFDSLDMEPAKDYIYTRESVTNFLDADGAVTSTADSETKEVMTLYDQEYERLIQKNGKPLPTKKQRAEQERFDKAVEKRTHETPQAKAKRLEAERKRAAEDLKCNNEFLNAFSFREEGADQINGRPAWIVDATPLPGVSLSCANYKNLVKLHLRIWVDQAEYRTARLQVDNIAPVTWGKALVRMPTGALKATLQQTRLKDGVWMVSSLDVHYGVRFMVFARLRMEMVETYSNYRKFQTDSQAAFPTSQ